MNLVKDYPLDTLEGCYLISNSFRVNRVIGESCTTATFDIEGNEYNINIYPNPVSDKLIIHSDIPISEIRSILITSIDGKSTKEIPPTLMNSPIDVSYLPPGINLLNINLKKEIINVRFIKR